jgi:glycerophosphoryl diester phosphodiesterase
MKMISAALIMMMAASVQAKPLIFAHRGAPFYAPENTTPSMQLALDLNADGIETDVYLTVDKKVMVMHDKTTSRTASGVNYDMKKTPSSVLEKVDVGSYKHECFKGTLLPYLQDQLDMKPDGKVMVIEIKDQPDTVAPVKKLIEATGRPMSEFTIISFNFDSCVEARKQMPDVDVFYLEGARDKKTKKMKKFKEDILHRAKDANLTGVDLDFHGVTKELVDKCHEMGMKFYVWTVDEEADVKRMTSFGVDSITTNLCDRARRFVDEATK